MDVDLKSDVSSSAASASSASTLESAWGTVLPALATVPADVRPTALTAPFSTYHPLDLQVLDFLVEDEQLPPSEQDVAFHARVSQAKTQLCEDGQPTTLVFWKMACDELHVKRCTKNTPEYASVKARSAELKAQFYRRSKRQCVVHVFGVTSHGQSVHVKVQHFMPYLFVQIGNMEDEGERFYRKLYLAEQALRAEFGEELADGRCVMTLEAHTPFFGFQDGKSAYFLKISSSTMRLRSSVKQMFVQLRDDARSIIDDDADASKKSRAKEDLFPLFEAKLPPLLRFLHECRLSPVGWLRIHPSASGELTVLDDPEKSVAAICVETSITLVESLPQRQGDIAPLLMASFDIECNSDDGSFPVPERPSDRVTQIGCVVQWFQPPPSCTDEPMRFIWVMDGCSPIANAVVRVCTNERDLLLSFADFIQRLDPDLLVGYNIYGFDWRYLYGRAKLLGVEREFSVLSRMGSRTCPIQESVKSSAAMGDNIQYIVPTPGRVQVDMLFVIKRDESLASYKLDDVASHFLKQNKHDVSPRQIWDLQRGSNDDRRVVAEYCIQDCLLPLRLMAKLDVLVKKMGMAHVCDVPLSFIFNRGQGIKLYSLVSKTCREMNYLLRDLEVPSAPMTESTSSSSSGRGRNSRDDDAAVVDDPLIELADEPGSAADPDDVGYAGAIVLLPKIGAHFEPVTVNDFNSLYPSASISHNLCPTRMISADRIHEFAHRDDLTVWTIKWRDIQSRDPDEWPQLLNDPEFDFRNNPREEARHAEFERPAHWRVWEAPMEPTAPYESDAIASAVGDMVAASPLREFHFVQPVQGVTEDERTRAGRGVVPLILIQLLEARKKYKNLMEEEEDPFKAAVLNGLQLSYKVTANSLYGQMGASTSAVRCEAVASSITATGRMLLLQSRSTILREFPGSIIVYGDTDSLFVKYPVDRSLDVVGQRESAIDYGNRLETVMKRQLVWPHKLAYEKVYDPMLLLNKKKYTGLLFENDPKKPKKTDSKGLINKRRDNAPIVQTIYARLLKSLMDHKNAERAVEQMRADVTDLLTGKVGMEQLIISKTLKKDYKTKTPPAHKALADRMTERDPGSAPQVGDRVPFLFVERASGKGAFWSKLTQGDVVEHPMYIAEQKGRVKIDYLYYLEHQLKTPLLEILSLFEDNPEALIHDLEQTAQLKRSRQTTLDSFFAKK